MVHLKITAQDTGFYAGLQTAFQISLICNSNDFDTGGDLDFDGTYTYAAGVDLGYKFKPACGIQTGFIYSKQGQNYRTANNVHANYKTELSYYKIPVLFNYYIRPEKKWSFIAQAGLQLSLLSEAKSSRENVFNYYSANLKDVKSYYSSYSIDLVVGIGIQYSIKKLKLHLLLRPDYSLSDIEKSEAKPGLRGPSSNLSFQLPQFGIQYFIN